MSMDMSMNMKKERIRELNNRQKVRFRTLLLPVLVAWNTLDTKATLLPVITLKYYRAAYHSTLFGVSLDITKGG